DDDEEAHDAEADDEAPHDEKPDDEPRDVSLREARNRASHPRLPTMRGGETSSPHHLAFDETAYIPSACHDPDPVKWSTMHASLLVS
ncbi:hypothetical protein, partial [Methylobacterium sp. E-045]|uniref:hypothetical protein n=1 Tax=Methylobacterium sp. E-045 TaxID=2836575 RepID=UPI001FB9D5B7